MSSEKMTAAEYRALIEKQNRAREHGKFHNVPTMTVDGLQMKSVHEATFYNKQYWLMKAGEVAKIEVYVRYELIVNNVFISTYELDFRITYPDGRVRHVDTKSQPTMTPLYRVKKQLMLACHGIALEEVFADQEGFVPRGKKGDKK
jgi:hypothetical protein